MGVECRNGMNCYNLECPFEHPPEWYTDRCPRGADCRFSDCPHRVHPRREVYVPCRDGMLCTRTPGTPNPCVNFLHPRAWFEEMPEGVPESRIPIGQEMAHLLRHGHMLELSNWAAQRGLRASLLRGNPQEGQHELVLRGLGVHEVVDSATVLLAQMAALIPDRIEHAGEEIIIPQSTAARLIGQRGQLLRMLARDLRVRLHVENADPSGPGSQSVLQSFGPTSALRLASQTLPLLCIDPSPAEMQLQLERAQLVDIFVDNSNLAICSQSQPDGSRDFSIRLNIPKLAREMQGVRAVRRKVAAGSKPPRDHAIWQVWENQGFEVNLTYRDPDNREQNVDEYLVAQALMHIANHQPGTLIIGTGDGNTNRQRPGTYAANFRNLATTAIRSGWRVEYWAWRCGCHSFYFELEKQHPRRFKVCLLDGLREFVTFRREGLRVAAPDIDGDSDEAAPNVDDDLCAICLEMPASHQYDPCGHRVLCPECADLITPHQGVGTSLSWCALCRSPFNSVSQA